LSGEVKSLEEGDTVMLVTGKGPVMSIGKILPVPVHTKDKGSGNVLCKWCVSKEKDFKEYYFYMSELKPYKPGPGVMVGGHR